MTSDILIRILWKTPTPIGNRRSGCPLPNMNSHKQKNPNHHIHFHSWRMEQIKINYCKSINIRTSFPLYFSPYTL